MSDLRWYVARTNPNCEERAHASLTEAGFQPYMPKLRRLIVHHRSKKEIEREFPLMTGYLFLGMPVNPALQHWGVVRTCDGVKGVLGVNGTPEPVPTKEVNAIWDAEFARKYDLALPVIVARRGVKDHGFKPGQPVEITSGPFSGFAGMVKDGRSKVAIRILTKIFGGMTEVEIPVDGLRLVA